MDSLDYDRHPDYIECSGEEVTSEIIKVVDTHSDQLLNTFDIKLEGVSNLVSDRSTQLRELIRQDLQSLSREITIQIEQVNSLIDTCTWALGGILLLFLFIYMIKR